MSLKRLWRRMFPSADERFARFWIDTYPDYCTRIIKADGTEVLDVDLPRLLNRS